MAPVARGLAGTRERRLARAGWQVLSNSSLATVDTTTTTDWEALGERLVTQVATCWGSRYRHTIRKGKTYEGACHYECLFSRPDSLLPVPSVVISVRFALVQPGPGNAVPRLLYSFEEGDLRHEWVLEQDAKGQWRATMGQQPLSLKHGIFEEYLDFYIREKEKVKSRGIALHTSFEASRAKPPQAPDGFEAAPEEDTELILEPTADGMKWQISPEAAALQKGAEEELALNKGPAAEDDGLLACMKEALVQAGLAREGVPLPASLSELLRNVFDAADEEDDGELTHYEMARVLAATLPGFGLKVWDIHLLLTTAEEDNQGFVHYTSFLERAPDIIRSLRNRRLSYEARGLPGVEIPLEAIRHCFGDEIATTVDGLHNAFDQRADADRSIGVYYYSLMGGRLPHSHKRGGHNGGNGSRRPSVVGGGNPGGAHHHATPQMELSPVPTGMEGEEEVLVALKRRVCRDCLQSFPERLSTQEVDRLMQMLSEDEHGMVHIEDLGDQLEHLRTEALLNSLVETDVASLRAHLIPLLQSMGMTSDGNLKVWKLKPALLKAESICLSRLQTHVLLCLAEPDDEGYVDLSTYMASLSVVIPHMCDAKIFVETAERLQSEHADATRRNENAELAALGAAQADLQRQEDGEEKHQESEVDQETVERTLIQVLSVLDKEHNGMLQPEVIWNVLTGGDAQVQGLQLSDFETYGLAAEMALDENGLVAYHDHVRRWIPIVFEVRKSPLLGSYLKEDAAETLGIPEPDIDALEQLYPTVEKQLTRSDTLGPKDQSRESVEHTSQELLHRTSSKDENQHRASVMAPRLGMRAGHHDHHGHHGEGHGHGHHNAHGHHGHHGHQAKGRSHSKVGTDLMASREPPPGRGYARRSLLVLAARTSLDDSRSQASIGSKDANGEPSLLRTTSKESITDHNGRVKPSTPG